MMMLWSLTGFIHHLQQIVLLLFLVAGGHFELFEDRVFERVVGFGSLEDCCVD